MSGSLFYKTPRGCFLSVCLWGFSWLSKLAAELFFPLLSPQNRFVSSGALGDLQGYQNSRFGSCIAAVPDLNQDSYNDVVVGAPLEDDHQGAIYIFLGFQETVLKKYKQVQLPGFWSAPSFTNQTQREVDVRGRQRSRRVFGHRLPRARNSCSVFPPCTVTS